jgi:hypothetical protein
MGIFKKLSKQTKAPKPPGAARTDPPRPMPPRRPIPGSTGTLGDRALNFGKPRTQLIDPKLPRGKVGKGPLEPRDSTTRVPAERSGLAGILKKRMAAQAMNPPKLKKGPGMKDGGSVQKMKRGWKCRWCRQLSKRRSKKSLPSKNSTFASSITSCTENCTRLRSSSRLRKSS